MVYRSKLSPSSCCSSHSSSSSVSSNTIVDRKSVAMDCFPYTEGYVSSAFSRLPLCLLLKLELPYWLSFNVGAELVSDPISIELDCPCVPLRNYDMSNFGTCCLATPPSLFVSLLGTCQSDSYPLPPTLLLPK